jgi:peptidoglycan/xylan/chitin deacetylase (PgdA/CDA1 family)
MRGFRAFDAVAIATLYVACADPPRKLLDETAGSSGHAPSAGAGGKGGATGGVAGTSSGSAGTKGGKGGSSAKGGKGGTAGTNGSGAAGGTGADGGSSALGGEGGMSAAGGEGGNPDGPGGEAGVGATTGGTAGMSGSAGGSGSAGIGGAAGMDSCTGVTVGGTSVFPAAPTTGVAKPAGTQGNLEVLNWAGFGSALSYTFDDATQSQLDNYALLNAVGVRMTFFLVCANDGGKAGWATAAADGHELGNHTMHHCAANGTNCAWGAFSSVDAELDDCTAHLMSAFSVPGVYTMASPYGDGAWVAPASARFVVNRGVSDNVNGVKPNDATNPYDLPCHLAAENEPAVGGFNTVTDSVRANGSWRIILNHSLGNNDGYHPIDPNELVAAMEYARDFGDVWIDTVANIGAYWRAQKAVSPITPTVVGDTMTYSWTLPAHFPPGQYLRVTVDGGTVKQCGTELPWNDHGYYEVALDAGSLTITP